MPGEIVEIVVDPVMIIKVSAAILGLCAFLIILLFRVTLSGLNKTITTCHQGLSKDNEHILEKHENHEKRITNIEHAVFIPIGKNNE